jgi:hypothetical protein
MFSCCAEHGRTLNALRAILYVASLVLPEQGENFQSWKWDELSVRARQHTVQDVLAM